MKSIVQTLRKKCNTSYKSKLTFTICILAFVFYAIVSTMIVFYSVNQHNRNYSDQINSIKDSINDEISDIINDMSDKVYYLINFKNLNSLLSVNKKIDINQAMENADVIKDVIETIFSGYPTTTVNIYTTNNNIFNMRHITMVDVIDYETVPRNGDIVCNFINKDGQNYLRFQKVYSYTNEFTNMIDITVPVHFSKTLLTTAETESFSIYHFDSVTKSVIKIEDNGSTIYEYKDFEKLLKAYGKHSYSTVKCGNTTGVFYILPYKNSLKYNIVKRILFLFIIFLFIAVIIFFIIKYIVDKLTKKLSTLVAQVNSSTPQLSFSSNKSYDEFDIILNKVTELAQQIKYETEENTIKEMELLSNRMSPHFLYNNLSIIKMKCKDKELSKTIDIMVAYFRKVFSCQGFTDTVINELDILKLYTKLLRFSYDEDFTYTQRVEPSCNNCLIPTGILQPIIENAFIHGINNYTKNGIINVIIKSDGTKLVILVENNGKVIDSEKINKALSEEKSATGIILKRLKLNYSDNFKYSYYYKNGLTTVFIVIPKSYGNSDDKDLPKKGEQL